MEHADRATSEPSPEAGARPDARPHRPVAGWAAVVGSLGVVFGDLGTSPLYTMKEALGGPHGAPIDRTNVLGVLSLVFWSLVLVVVVKYVLLVMRADNRGEGGILSIAAILVPPAQLRRRLPWTVALALVGCGLLFGDGMITPVISVMSAIEGIDVVYPDIRAWVVPITIAILIALFAVQRHGTARIGAVFGPIMLAWFVAIAVAGIPHIVARPEVLAAIDPRHAIAFFAAGGWDAFWVLGAVVLAVTGVEALYADMGHFGRRPIQRAWAWIVFPAVLCSYFGQGAVLLDRPVGLPFFHQLPHALVVPMVVLATLATVIASQALITGVFSLVHQAVQLGFLPRIQVIHTSETHAGQIYVPAVNAMLAVACVAIALGFRSSSALAAAFGIAVSSTMAITTILLYRVAIDRWRWPAAAALAVIAPLVAIDLVYTAANMHKLAAGGWLPLAAGLAAFVVMSTWWRGTVLLRDATAAAAVPEPLFLDDLATAAISRTRGTGVFMTSSPTGIPTVVLHLVKNIKALPAQVILLSVVTEPRPWVPGNTALTVTPLRHGVTRVVARIGFMQSAHVPRLLARCSARGLEIDQADATYYLGRNAITRAKRSRGTWRWRRGLFGFLVRNAGAPTQFFGLPPNRTVELGTTLEI